ncbi:response regulator transcription factor [Oricola cellulosilytica]|uniref:Response regulator transcription factor n=1 Tax=Oricola cellulosilytica TaxID=1429082 RepID=A0A4R0PCC3_9HYPH|nr:response regulator transcription factor [Oricola cellulosilytica]TCD13828.1 response regulator transcription factor [Oricola cellulosilytica]
MQQHVLIVDDDRQLTSFLERFFKKHGYRATSAASCAELFAAVEKDRFDLIVLDLILPDEDGMEAARQLRRSNDVPIIMLTARDELFDRVVGLELGADDYVTKPYEPRELLARVRSVLRRHGRHPVPDPEVGGSPTNLRFANIELDLVKSTARRWPDRLDLGLTSTEFALLKALAGAQGNVLTREEILHTVYGNSIQVTDRAIDTHMVRLRRKLADAGADADLLLTVHGVGYKLAAMVQAVTGEQLQGDNPH